MAEFCGARAAEYILNESGVDEEVEPRIWQNALSHAARYGNANFIRMLVNRGLADVEADDEFENTAEDLLRHYDAAGCVDMKHLVYLKKNKKAVDESSEKKGDEGDNEEEA